MKVEEEVLHSSERSVEADVMSSRCKVCDSFKELDRVLDVNSGEAVRSKNGRREWFHDDKRMSTVLKSER